MYAVVGRKSDAHSTISRHPILHVLDVEEELREEGHLQRADDGWVRKVRVQVARDDSRAKDRNAVALHKYILCAKKVSQKSKKEELRQMHSFYSKKTLIHT